MINDKEKNVGKNRQESMQDEYEPTIQRLEAEIRGHIKVEQQLKLQIEYLQEKVEEQKSLEDKIQSLSQVIYYKSNRSLKTVK